MVSFAENNKLGIDPQEAMEVLFHMQDECPTRFSPGDEYRILRAQGMDAEEARNRWVERVNFERDKS